MFVYILNLPVDEKINMEVDACAETGFHDIRSGIVKSDPVYSTKKTTGVANLLLLYYMNERDFLLTFSFS